MSGLFASISLKVLSNSLKYLLECEENVEDVFMMNFVISYKDVFGNTITHTLMENGENTPVTNANRQVWMYAINLQRPIELCQLWGGGR